MKDNLLVITGGEKQIFLDGRKVQRAYEEISRLTMELLMLSDNVNVNISEWIEERIIETKAFVEKAYDRISEIEKKYLDNHLELEKMKGDFDKAHEKACYCFASEVKSWGQE
jgi:hypothetical protein